MDLFNRKNLLIRRTHFDATICTFHSMEGAASFAEVFIRNANGMHYLKRSFSDAVPPAIDLYYQTYQSGIDSARPYQLQMATDESVFYCVVALSVSCCKAWNLEPIELIRSADPAARVTEDDLLDIKALARWQNTVFPGTWVTPTIQALIQALDDVGCAALGAAIEEQTIIPRGY